jgi:hypothetical protein
MLFAHLKRILRLGRLRLRGPRGAQFEFTLAFAIRQSPRAAWRLIASPILQYLLLNGLSLALSCTAYRLLAGIAQSGEVLFDAQQEATRGGVDGGALLADIRPT